MADKVEKWLDDNALRFIRNDGSSDDEAMLRAALADPECNEALTELGILQRTVKHQEEVYLREHGGSWGKCKYQSQVETAEAQLAAALRDKERLEYRDGEPICKCGHGLYRHDPEDGRCDAPCGDPLKPETRCISFRWTSIDTAMSSSQPSAPKEPSNEM